MADYSQMTDEELDNYERQALENLEKQKSGNVLNPALQAAKERWKTESAPKEDHTQGMSGPELFAAGMGKQFMKVPRGIHEIGVGAFGSPKEIERYNVEKAAQGKIDSELDQNWEANAGGFAGQAVGAAAGPARIGAQTGLAALGAALSPTKGDIKGVEPLTRAVQGVEAGATTTAVGVPMGIAGKMIGARTPQSLMSSATRGVVPRPSVNRMSLTPEAEGSVEAGRAARRIGMTPDSASLNAGLMPRSIEEGSGWYPGLTRENANIFNAAAGREMPVATSVLGQTTTRQIPGETLRAGIEQAGRNLRNEGSNMWNQLDEYVVTNNLPTVVAAETQRTAQSIAPAGRNSETLRYIQRADDENGTVTAAISNMVRQPNGRNRVPTPTFAQLHDIQSTVGRALARAKRDASAPNSSAAQDEAVQGLNSLYRSISRDVDNWSTTNPTAGEMFQQAKGFWRDTVVPHAINNDLVKKASQGSLGRGVRGYDEPRQMFTDIINKPEEAKALYTYLDQRSRDLITSLHLLPEVGNTMTAPRLQSVAAVGPSGRAVETGLRESSNGGTSISGLARAPTTKPGALAMILGHIPGSRALGTSQTLQELNLANNAFRDSPLGRATWAGAQYPQSKAEEFTSSIRIRK